MGSFVDSLAAQPAIFNSLRRLIENNFKGEKRVIAEYFRLTEGELLLDIGCGTGEFSSLFNASAYTGIDIDAQYIAYARKHHRGIFIIGDAERLPFLDRHFDKVLVIGMFHHLNHEKSGRILQEIQRVLKQEGRALIMEDVHRDDHPWLIQKLHRMDKGEYILTEEQYVILFEKYFQVEKSFQTRSGLSPYQVLLLRQRS